MRLSPWFVFLLSAVMSLLTVPLAAKPVTTEKSDTQADMLPDLTDAERQWLAGHPVVTFTGDPNWLPFEGFDHKGNYIGIVSEHLALISQFTGIRFRAIPSKTWTGSTEKAKQGLVDVLSETDDSDLKSHLNFTEPYLSNPIVIAMQYREHFVENIASIRDRRIAVIRDYGYVSKIRRTYSDIDFVTVRDINDGLLAVSTGRVDALLCTLALCSYTIAELGINNVKIAGKTEFETRLALGVQKDLPELLTILNKALRHISRNQQQVILDGWIRQKFVAKTDYTLVYQVVFGALVLVAIFVFWNRRLSREINLRKSIEKELKNAEEVLRFSQQRLLLHREKTPLGVIEWNTAFEIADWNPAAQRIFGYTKDEVLGQHITNNILPESARPAMDIVWSDLLARRGGQRSTNENITKDGRTILCEWYNTPLVDPDGKVIGVASLVDDITERHRAEKELEQYRDHLETMVAERTAEIEAANMELESFSYSVSHDLRSPLRSIDGFSQLLIEDYSDQVDDVGKNYLQRVRKSAQRMGRLIDDMLSLSRVTRGQLHLEQVDLSQLAQSTLNKLQESEPKRQVIVEIESGIQGQVDKGLFGVVLDNLIGNAWKYTGKIPQARIKFGVLQQEDKTVWYVSDNGAGFDMDYVGKLFGAFQRLHKSDEFEGTGIGLATVARIIQRHGGEVWAEGKTGKGATFYFTTGIEVPVRMRRNTKGRDALLM